MRAILLDIEGTTSSISYVHDVLFPYARRNLPAYLRDNWNKPETMEVCEQIARDADAASLQAFTAGAPPEQAQAKIAAEVLSLMDRDAKATGLKALQGLIWEHGFCSGQLRAHVYPDVPPALAAWNAAGLDVRIYSSGSIAAQKLFFAHTEAGDLLKFIRGHYDTTSGPKKIPASYRAIATAMNVPPGEILFVSDIVAELNAAREAGLATALSIRPGNAKEENTGHRTMTDFSQIG
jgi:enolase-phosphatase E1